MILFSRSSSIWTVWTNYREPFTELRSPHHILILTNVAWIDDLQGVEQLRVLTGFSRFEDLYDLLIFRIEENLEVVARWFSLMYGLQLFDLGCDGLTGCRSILGHSIHAKSMVVVK